MKTRVITFTGLVLLFVLFTLQPGCFEDPPLLEETVSQPFAPAGDSATVPGDTIILTTGGSVSSRGHAIEYRFDLDAGGIHDVTDWSDVDSVAASWPDTGLYAVIAQARCAEHTTKVSPWSLGKTINVAASVFTELPRMVFATQIGGVSKPYVYDTVADLDTVGAMQPFSISYHGLSVNGGIRKYMFFPLTPGVILDGQDVWTDDLSDTLRTVPDTGGDALPSGIFRLAAKCLDLAYAESPVDAGTYDEGVCQVVVNFDPDTRITGLVSSYTVDDVVHQKDINFEDAIPDTVPYDSWLRLDYEGWDDPRDVQSCPPSDPNKCIGFQVAYYRESERIPGAAEFSMWLPRGELHDTDPFSASDSNTFHIGSLEYDLFARAVDENGRPDGTPPSVPVIGNFDPVMDAVAVTDHLGNQIDLSFVDEVTWNFWKGEGWPYQCECDTVAKPQQFCDSDFSCGGRQFPGSNGSFDFYKSWSVHIQAQGHDNAMDPSGSGVKAWQYVVKNSQGEFLNLGKGLAGWFDGFEVDRLDDTIRWTAYYPGLLKADPDPMGDTVFDNLPDWLDEDLTFFLIGRDTRRLEGEFEQSVFINGNLSIINVFPAATLGRWTQEEVFTFRVTLVR